MVSLLAYTELALALIGFFLSGVNGAVLVEGNADTQDVDDRQRSRFVRREQGVGESFAEIPHRQPHLSPEDVALENAKQTAMEAAGLKAATEVQMAKTIATMKAKEEEADKKRLVAEAVVEALETKKATAEHVKAEREKAEKEEAEKAKQQKSHPKAKPEHKAHKAHQKSTSTKAASAHKKSDKAINLLADEAKQKAEEAEKIKFESLHKAIRSRMGLGIADQENGLATSQEHAKASAKHDSKDVHKATVSGLPEIAFASDAYFVNKEEHFANLMKVILERKRARGDSADDLTDVWCDKDYPLGLWNTSECSSDDATSHQIIESEEMCLQAAEQANATAGDGAQRYFVIPSEWGDLHPKGCFVFPCHWDPGHVCYWFNSQEDTPLYPWGAPVCSRPLFRNGTANTNSGCPSGYDVIMNENNCTEAAYCKSYCVEENYLVGEGYPTHNASTHDVFPEGCFIHEEQGCVYYNEPYGPNPPQNPKGIPLCNVTQITHFPEVELPWDIFW